MPDETRPRSVARQCICDRVIYPCDMNGSYPAVIDSLQEGQAFQHVAGLRVVAMQLIYLGNHCCIVAMAEKKFTCPKGTPHCCCDDSWE